MRTPSSRILNTAIDFYSATQGQDADGGIQFTYPTIPTRAGVAAMVEAKETEIVQDEQMRLTQEKRYRILTAQPLAPKPRDKVLWTDAAGTQHTIFLEVERDDVGQGTDFCLFGVERAVLSGY